MQLGLTPLQVKERRAFIGGSDAGDIVSGDWLRLWRIKTGRAESEDLSDILAVMMGHATEDFNRFWFEKQTGHKVHRVGELARHPTAPYLACNLDGVVTRADGRPASFQAKHVGKSGDQLVLRYTAQCTHEALCIGADWWVMSAFIGNSRWEMTAQEVDPFFAADYLRKCEQFWGFVERDEEPPEVPPLPVPSPRKLRIVHLEDEIDDWPNWGPAMVEELAAWQRTLPAYKAHNVATGKIKDLLPEDVGTVIRGRLKVARDRAGAVRISMKMVGETDG